MRITAAVVMTALAAASVGCAGNGDGLDENGRPLDGEPGELRAEFQSIQDHVFTPICTACHAGAAAPLGLRLDEGVAFAMLVNAPSVQVPGLLRVDPGNPDASYLIQKLEGTAEMGERMPLDRPPLAQPDIDLIRQWIIDGAQPPQAQLASTEPIVLRAIVTQPQQRTAGAVEIVVAADGELDTTSLHASSVQLTHAGPDGQFGSDDDLSLRDLKIAVRYLAPTSVTISVPATPLATGWYRLTLAGSGPMPVAGRNAMPIDGNADREAGGDFLHDFELRSTP